MARTYYNLPGVEELEQFAETTRTSIEDSASSLLAHAGVIQDGTRGEAAGSHEETSALADQVSAKAAEVIQLVKAATAQARESTIEVDAAGGKSMAWGG